MNLGAWWAADYGVAKSWTRLSTTTTNNNRLMQGNNISYKLLINNYAWVKFCISGGYVIHTVTLPSKSQLY